MSLLQQSASAIVALALSITMVAAQGVPASPAVDDRHPAGSADGEPPAVRAEGASAASTSERLLVATEQSVAALPDGLDPPQVGISGVTDQPGVSPAGASASETPVPRTTADSGRAATGSVSATATPTRPATGVSDIPAGITRDAQRLDAAAVQIDLAAGAGDWPATRQRWQEFDDLWFDVEDGIRAAFPQRYRAIEDAMGAVKDTLRPEAPSKEAVRREVAGLRAQLRPLLPSEPSIASPNTTAGTPATSDGTAVRATTTPTAVLHAATPTAAPTPVPASCLTPSLNLSASSVNSEGYLDSSSAIFLSLGPD